MAGDPAYELGRFLGPIMLVALVGYVIVRLAKKRNPNSKEWIIMAIIGLVLSMVNAMSRGQV